MRIAIDLRPAVTGIKRGIYFYTRGLWGALREFDAENEYVGLESYPLLGYRAQSKYATVLWDRLVLPFYLRSHRIDVLHLTSPNESDFNFTKGGKLKNYQIVATIHDIIPFLFPEKLLDSLEPEVRRTFERQFQQALKADHLVAISQATRKDLIGHFGVSEEKISVVYQCNHGSRFHPRQDKDLLRLVREKYHLPAEYVLNPSGRDYHKNFDRVITAYARLPKDLQRHYGLVIQAWLPPAELRRRQELAGKLDLMSQVKFITQVDERDLPLLYNAATLTLTPSLYEGFGLSPLEGMASGTPVIAGNNSAQPEVCGKAALLVNAEDEEAIMQTIERLLSNQRLRQDLIKKGLQQSQKFSQERRARETVAVYEKVFRS